MPPLANVPIKSSIYKYIWANTMKPSFRFSELGRQCRTSLESFGTPFFGAACLKWARLCGAFNPRANDEPECPGPTGRRAVEVVVVANDAMHLGPRKVQRLGDLGHRIGRHMAQLVLDVVKDRQQRPGCWRRARKGASMRGGVSARINSRANCFETCADQRCKCMHMVS